MRCVLGLFEGVVTGAADGYARMAEKPACTLLHLGPGLANGLANLHNASGASGADRQSGRTTCHLSSCATTRHLRPISKASRGHIPNGCELLLSSSEVGRDAAEAIIAARTAPGQIATLIVPADVAWTDGGTVAALPVLPRPPLPAAAAIDRAVAMLRSGLPTAILISGNALYGKGLAATGRIATATNAKLLAPYPVTRLERGRRHRRGRTHSIRS